MSSGVSGNFVVGSLASTVRAAGSGAVPGSPDPTFAKGALVLAAVAPGMAPYEAARAGIGERFEGGVTYTGRAAHLDVRRSFDWHDVSLSIGLGVETPIHGDSDTSSLPQVDLSSVRGYGADVPVLVGWRSVASAYQVWGGVRAGWDHTDVGSPWIDDAGSLSANRLYGGAVVGLAAGFRHVHAALELDIAYQSVTGSLGETNVSVAGLSVAPAAAAWWTFW